MKKIISWVIRHIPRKYLQLISPLALRILAVFYRGNRVECPICESRFAKFLPYGRGKSARPNALCPRCQSLERHRLIWLYLKDKTDFFTRKQHFLHIAPENCFMERFEKMPQLEYITADLESPLAKVKMDIHEMPFEDNTFDAAMCNHVLEHVHDDIQAMREIHRVLKPGGWAILQVPMMKAGLKVTYEDKAITEAAERFKAFGQEDHVRMYGEDYGKRLLLGGFEVSEDRYVLDLDQALVARYALPGKEIVYFCRKKDTKT
ncbi:MAG: class I SAM-dependent methyltransferase [Microscillaceae bacterium]|nr:class I SAM-dependent methyltransferase [Microscillaceae bacterium]